VAFFRFRHSQEDAATFLVRLVGREVPIHQRGLTLGAPVGLERFHRYVQLGFHFVMLCLHLVSAPAAAG
jgi:hypothetical protein